MTKYNVTLSRPASLSQLFRFPSPAQRLFSTTAKCLVCSLVRNKIVCAMKVGLSFDSTRSSSPHHCNVSVNHITIMLPTYKALSLNAVRVGKIDQLQPLPSSSSSDMLQEGAGFLKCYVCNMHTIFILCHFVWLDAAQEYLWTTKLGNSWIYTCMVVLYVILQPICQQDPGWWLVWLKR